MKPAPGPDAQPTLEQKTPVEAFPTAMRLYIGVQCRDMPADGWVGLRVPGPDGAPLVHLPATAIHSPNMTICVLADWPACFATEITITYWKGSHWPPPTAGVYPLLMEAMQAPANAPGAVPLDAQAADHLLPGLRFDQAAE